MRITLVLLAVVVCVRGFPSQDSLTLQAEWEEFKEDFGKSYSDESEENFRFKVFQQTREEILEHNKRFATGEESYELGINRFSDLLPREFENLMLRSREFDAMDFDVDTIPFEPTNASLPAAVDWRNVGALNSVRDQGQCGSCWAFAAVATLESHTFLKTRRLPSLSEQNLVDCDSNSSGCYGGLASKAFAYINSNGGIDTRISYPYEALDRECRFNSKTIGATVRGTVAIERDNELALQEAVGTVGPIAVSIAVGPGWQNYRSGVYNNPDCGYATGHAVVVVGYGVDEKHGEFWLVRNSWGSQWGDQGYIRMARNKDNQCAIAVRGVYPLV